MLHSASNTLARGSFLISTVHTISRFPPLLEPLNMAFSLDFVRKVSTVTC